MFPNIGYYCQAWNRKHSEGTLCAVDKRQTYSPIKIYSLSSKKPEKNGIVFKENFVSATKDAVMIEQVIWCTYPCLHRQGLWSPALVLIVNLEEFMVLVFFSLCPLTNNHIGRATVIRCHRTKTPSTANVGK